MSQLNYFYDVEAQLERSTKKFHSHKLYYEYLQMLSRFSFTIKFVFSKKDTEKFLEIRQLHLHIIFLYNAKEKLKQSNPINKFISYYKSIIKYVVRRYIKKHFDYGNGSLANTIRLGDKSKYIKKKFKQLTMKFHQLIYH